MSAPSRKSETIELMGKLGVKPEALEGGDLAVYSPTNGEKIADVKKVQCR